MQIISQFFVVFGDYAIAWLKSIHEFVARGEFVLYGDRFVRFQFFVQQAHVTGEGFFFIRGVEIPKVFAHFHGGDGFVDAQAE